MNQITNISDAPDQILNLILDDGSLAVMELVFRPAIQRWSMNIIWPAPAQGQAIPAGTFVANNINMCVGANLLRQWRNLIPFGVTCTSLNGADPFDIKDFLNGRVQLYVLNASDVLLAETVVAEAVS